MAKKKTRTVIVGIDPGFSGAIAFFDSATRQLKIRDLPIKKIMNRRQIDARAFSQIIKPFIPYIKFAAIEDVHAMPGQGVVSTFRFGYNAGILLGVLEAHRIQVLRVNPSSWKSALNLSSNKKDSLKLAIKKFPIYKAYFARMKDDGRAEAALIASYAGSCF